MNDRSKDIERAEALGMSLKAFQELVGYDPLDVYSEFLNAGLKSPKDGPAYEEPKSKKKKKENKDKIPEEASSEAGGPGLSDNFDDMGESLIPFETDTDVRNKTAKELENHWDRPIETPADKALYYGFHIHSKDNAYGLHAHYPDGPLGGGHLHGPQNTLGYHTHRYNQEELLQFKFARPGIMIELDGPHNHQHNAPDGKHNHQEENFGPATGIRADEVAARNAKTDKN